MKIILIGAGNVAVHLGPLLKKNGHKIIQVYNRTKKNGTVLARKLGCDYTNDINKIFPVADIYIIALRDEAIWEFLTEINFTPKLIVHTSGSIGINVFNKSLKNFGVIYPLQTFSKSSKITPEEIPFCIEGNDKKSLAVIKKLARSLSKLVYTINSEDRRLIHLAAVFVNNFSNHLFTIAGKILGTKKIPFSILRPLILETAKKVQSDLPAKMQTGPARRNDKIVIKNHLNLLNKFPEMKVIYNLLSKSIEKEYNSGM